LRSGCRALSSKDQKKVWLLVLIDGNQTFLFAIEFHIDGPACQWAGGEMPIDCLVSGGFHQLDSEDLAGNEFADMALCRGPLDESRNAFVNTISLLEKISQGVKTKNRKNAVTVLLDIPDLLDAVCAWDKIVRGKLDPTSTWFAALSAVDGGESVIADKPAITANRDSILRQEVDHLFDLAGLPYMSPHKFRHGHATYGLKQAKDIGDLKAVSQNLMHANIGITDGIYAILSTEDMQDRIASLGKSGGTSVAPGAPAPLDTAGVVAIVEETIKRLVPQAPSEPARPKTAHEAK
jgi:hypothetical protein